MKMCTHKKKYEHASPVLDTIAKYTCTHACVYMYVSCMHDMHACMLYVPTCFACNRYACIYVCVYIESPSMRH